MPFDSLNILLVYDRIIIRKNQQYFFLDDQSEKKSFDYLGALDEFNTNMAYFKIGSNSLMGVLDSSLSIVLKPEFESIRVRNSTQWDVKKNGRFNIYLTGKDTMLFDVYYDSIRRVGSDFFIVTSFEEYALLDSEGETIIPFQEFRLKSVGNKLIQAYDNNGKLVGYYDQTGRKYFK